MAELIEDFYGVYLLHNISEQYKGRIYIGKTDDPNRRIKQHNHGTTGGGARKTSEKGPWEMALVVHGFPNSVSALQFEWAWQNPTKSRRLRHVGPRKSREKALDYSLRILGQLLAASPWSRLPLTVRWLKESCHRQFPANGTPPVHMPITFGPVISKKLDIQEAKKKQNKEHCFLCAFLILDERDILTCLAPACPLVSHMRCLAKHFTADESNYILPVRGYCPCCQVQLLWGDLVRKKKGCSYNISLSS